MIKNREFNGILSGFAGSGNARVYIFGSRARGDGHPASDIDVGVEFVSDEKSGIKIALLREKFENSNIPQKVDVVNLSEVSEEFKKEVMKEAVLWKG